jgi:UDP-N-acetylglucosamine enolpyruvyl transferase
MATKAGKVSRRRIAVSRDYLFVAANNVLVIVSGATGETHTLNAADTKEVLQLLKQRQKIGNKVTALLKKRGFSVGGDDIIVNLNADD